MRWRKNLSGTTPSIKYLNMFDLAYPKETYFHRHEYFEGILNNKSGKLYPNKITAMLECEHVDHLEVYTEFKKTKKVSDKNLNELYCDRLRELRKKYDYLELSWGGGHDSTMILEISKQTNCPLDVISMQCMGDLIDTSGFNSEITKNMHHVDEYIKVFPQTKVYHLDLEKSYKSTVENYNDIKKWCYLGAQAMLDDFCKIPNDLFIAERQNHNGAIITGNGWKNVIYNKKLDIWSLYLGDQDINHPGAISFHIPTIRFYETEEICMKIGHVTRNWYYSHTDKERDQSNMIADKDNLWAISNEWMHDNIMYVPLRGKIWHDDDKVVAGNGRWQEGARFKFFTTDPTARTKYKEYFDFLEYLNKNIHPSCFTKEGVGLHESELKSTKAFTIDF